MACRLKGCRLKACRLKACRLKACRLQGRDAGLCGGGNTDACLDDRGEFIDNDYY